jgi:hypothetical protein
MKGTSPEIPKLTQHNKTYLCMYALLICLYNSHITCTEKLWWSSCELITDSNIIENVSKFGLTTVPLQYLINGPSQNDVLGFILSIQCHVQICKAQHFTEI